MLGGGFLRGLGPARRVTLLQLFIGFVVVVLWFLVGALQAHSAMMGLLVAVIPQLFFAKKVFAKQGARAARNIVNAFYVGEALKWALTIFLFTLVFLRVKPLDAVALISTFTIVQLMVPPLALLTMKKT